MFKLIRVTEEVWKALADRGHKLESFDDILRKVLGLSQREA